MNTMKRQEVQAAIPIALQELHDNGIERAYVDELAIQVAQHDVARMELRDKIGSVLSVVGINVDKISMLDGRPSSYKMYRSLGILEQSGIVDAEFETSSSDGSRGRRQYFLRNYEAE